MHIEAGKFYRTRGGHKAGPMEKHDASGGWIACVSDRPGSRRLFLMDGTHGDGKHIINTPEFDIVAEWHDELDATAGAEWPLDAPQTDEDATGKLIATDQMRPYPRRPLGHIWAVYSEAGYEPLARVLQDAHDQAASGKGKQRHNGRGIDFDRQPIMEIGRMCGLGYPSGQAQKKTQEAVSMLARGEPDRAIAELLGAINYLAAAVLLIREQNPGA